MSEPLQPARYQLGRHELSPQERLLRRDGEVVELGARAFDLLLVLLERRDRLVTKAELLEAVWPGLVVEENNIAAQVSALRKALGSESIATIPGRGYRLSLAVRVVQPAAGVSGVAGTAAPVLTTQRPPEPTRTAALLRQPPLRGRESDLHALQALLQRHALVTLLGAGGMGKTRLAQTLLEQLRGARRHGVCWVDLAPLGDAAALPGALLSALGAQAPGGDALEGLCATLANLELLLVLDNAEHLLAPVAELVQAVLDSAPGVSLLVTSQAPLKLAAEQGYRLEALQVPQADASAAQALTCGAVALLVDRIQATDARWRLLDQDVPAVVSLCRQLDALPLALELAAARAATLGVAKLSASLQDRLQLLGAGRPRGAPARQQTLRAALEWSHALLSPAEQRVFRRLAVVAGSATLALVQNIAADPEPGAELDRWAVLDALGGLVERSLVALEPAEEPRYRLLNSPRALALERLREAGEEPALRQRHARALARQWEADYADAFSGLIAHDAWTARQASDLDNAREALAWAEQARDLHTVLQLAPTALRALPNALHAERLALCERCEALLAEAPAGQAADPLLLMRLLGRMAAARGVARLEHSLALARRAWALADTPTEPSSAEAGRLERYLCACVLATLAARAADIDTAQQAVHDAGALELPEAPPQQRWFLLEARHCLSAARGDAQAALDLLRQQIEAERAAGRDAALARAHLVAAEKAAGQAQAAVVTGTMLVDALAGSRDEFALCVARQNLAEAYLALRDTAAARQVALAGWPQALRFGLGGPWARTLAQLARLESRPEAARQLEDHAAALSAAFSAALAVGRPADLPASAELQRLAFG